MHQKNNSPGSRREDLDKLATQRFRQLSERFDLRESTDESLYPSTAPLLIDDLRPRNLEELFVLFMHGHAAYRRQVRKRLLKKVAKFSLIVLVSMLAGIGIGVYVTTQDTKLFLSLLQFVATIVANLV